MERDNIKSLRPDIPGLKDKSYSNDMELYQSEVLRPIAKYQNALILKTFHSYLSKYKLTLEGKSIKDQETIVVQAMKTNKELKNFYQGLIASLMTNEEFDFYTDHRSEINKRITTLLAQRIVSQAVR